MQINVHSVQSVINVHFYCFPLVIIFSNTRSCQTFPIVLNACQTIIMHEADRLFQIMTVANSSGHYRK